MEPSQDFCSKILSKLGVTTSWFDPLIGADIVKHLQPNTKIVFLESPQAFITMESGRSGDCCRRAHVVPDAIIMIDNTGQPRAV
ncbi:PLP-dependent transferase [Escherichia coli]